MNAPLLPALPGYANPELIAHGTTALVFRAIQTTLNRPVAIKVITVDTGSVPVNAARELATTVALSSQPHIVSIIDTGVTDDDRPYIVMEYCEGGSYASILRQGGPLPLADVLEVGVKIGEALHAAHQAGIVHRDVKPSNILRSRFGPALTDFGIARAPDELGSTLTRELMTPHHASPEALLHQAQSGISDVYSLASTMWTLLVGHPPFVDPLQPAMDMYAFRDRVLHDELPAMPREDVPAWLLAELRRAMSKLPSARHRSALEFAESLRRGALGLDPSAPARDAGAEGGPARPVSAPPGSGTGGSLSTTGSSRLAAANAAGVMPSAALSAYGQPSTFVPPPQRDLPGSTIDRVAPLPTYVSPWTSSPTPPAGPSTAAAPAAPVSSTPVPVPSPNPTGAPSREDTGGASAGGSTGGRRSAAASRPPVIPPLAATQPGGSAMASPPSAPWALPPTASPAAPAPTPAAPEPAPAAAVPAPPVADPGQSGPTGQPYPTYPSRRLDERAVPPSNRRGVLVGVLVALTVIAIAGAGVVVLLAKDRAGQVGQGPVGPSGVASGAPSPQATKFLTPDSVGAPTNVRLVDQHTSSITVIWDDPSPGTVSFVVLGYGPNNERLESKTVPRGVTSTTFNQLSPTRNYCFVVGAVYSADRIPTANSVCTRR